MDEDDQKVLLTAWLSRNRELLTWAMIPITVEHNQFQKYVPVLWTLRAPLDHWDKNPEVTLLIVRKIWERGWNVMSSMSRGLSRVEYISALGALVLHIQQ